MSLTPIIVGVLTPIVRSVAGWLENALDDGKISPFEWSQLGATFFRVGILSAASMGVFSAFVGNDQVVAFAGAGAALIADFILKRLQK